MAYGFGTEALNKRQESVGGDGTKSEWWKAKKGAQVGESVPNPIRIVTYLEEMGAHPTASGKPQTCIGKEAGCPRCVENDAYRAQHGNDKEMMKKNPHKVSVKFLCWLLDLADVDETTKQPKFKLAQLGWGIVGAVNDLFENPDWKPFFKNGIAAMKLTVMGEKTGNLPQNVEYSVQPSPSDPMTPDLQAEADKLDDIRKIAFNLKKKQAKEWNIDLPEPAYLGAPDAPAPAEHPLGQDETKVEDIPF